VEQQREELPLRVPQQERTGQQERRCRFSCGVFCCASSQWPGPAGGNPQGVRRPVRAPEMGATLSEDQPGPGGLVGGSRTTARASSSTRGVRVPAPATRSSTGV
jgi:hypothetical protein